MLPSEYYGLEYYLHEGKDAIRLQLAALILAYVQQRNIRIMFPMINDVNKDRKYILNELLAQVKEALWYLKQNSAFTLNPETMTTAELLKNIPRDLIGLIKEKEDLEIPFGFMTETPSAAMAIDNILNTKGILFTSYGTNDLIKLTFNGSRDEEQGRAFYDNFKLEISQLMQKGVEAAEKRR